MSAPLAYVAARSRRPPRSAHTDWPVALPLISQQAMSTAESASVKMPPGPELPAARRSLPVIASTFVGSSPTVRRACSSTAALSAGFSAPPKNVRPLPISPWSVPSSSVTKSRVSAEAGRPTTSGLSAGVRSARVVRWVIFIGLSPSRLWSPTIHFHERPIHQGPGPVRPRPPYGLHRSRAVRARDGPDLRARLARPGTREPGPEPGRLLHDQDGPGVGDRDPRHGRDGARARQPLRSTWRERVRVGHQPGAIARLLESRLDLRDGHLHIHIYVGLTVCYN